MQYLGFIQVDAAHWWWLSRPPPHMIVKRFGCTAIHNKALYNASFIHSFRLDVKITWCGVSFSLDIRRPFLAFSVILQEAWTIVSSVLSQASSSLFHPFPLYLHPFPFTFLSFISIQVRPVLFSAHTLAFLSIITLMRPNFPCST